jgi:hypothetical protein
VVVSVPVAEQVAGSAATPAAVLASLAVPLRGAGIRSVLVLRASTAGAFVRMADDLDVLLGSGCPPSRLDQDLSLPAASTGAALAVALADLRLLDRALGVLIDQGWAPEDGEVELHRRAAEAGMTSATFARWLVAPPGPAGRL